MGIEENKAMARRYIEAINTDDFDELGRLLSPDFDDHVNVPGIPPGLEGAKQAHLMLREAFPDIRFTLEDVMAEGDKVVLRATGGGTHKGSFFGIPATGKAVSWTGIRIMRAAGGQFVEGINEFDQVGILQQIGVIPAFGPPPPAGESPQATN